MMIMMMRMIWSLKMTKQNVEKIAFRTAKNSFLGEFSWGI